LVFAKDVVRDGDKLKKQHVLGGQRGELGVVLLSCEHQGISLGTQKKGEVISLCLGLQVQVNLGTFCFEVCFELRKCVKSFLGISLKLVSQVLK
jgi:hypothetical protein